MKKVVEERLVTEYRLKWLGWDETDEVWREASECHCQDLIDEYELRLRQRDEEEDVAVGVKKTPVVQLGVATVVEWWLQDKRTARQSVRPVSPVLVRVMSRRCESGLACGSAVQSRLAAAA